MVALKRGAMDRTRGYTLLELMMVVVLIGISVAIALPTMSTAMAEQKQGDAAMQVITVFRTARDIAMRRGTPTLVLAAAPGRFWIVPAPRQPGVVSSCGSADWLVLAVPLPATNLDLVAGTGPFGERFDWNRYGISAAFNVAAPAVCYSPLGRVYLSVAGAGGPYSDAQGAVAGGALVVTINRTFSNARRVVVPMGSGMPRLGI